MTKICVGDRQSGKTVRLILRSCLDRQIIVAATSVSVRYIKQKATELGLNIPEPITYGEFINNRHNEFINNEGKTNETNKFLIDELQIFLSRLNVDEATLDKDSVSYLTKPDK